MDNKNNRNSIKVKIGRIFQKISPLFRFIDFIPYCFYKRILKKPSKYPTIILLAPPRSGSTLMYQILSSGIKNIHLTNIWNVLFANPLIGGLISDKMAGDNYISDFKSNKGFVDGLNGEAEGLKFWSFWAGQTMDELKNVEKKRLNYLLNVIELLKKKLKKPFISGYLGHVLAISQLKNKFRDVLFIYLRRDLLDNAFSLYNLSPENMFSTKTKETGEKNLNRYQQIAIQLISIHEKIMNSIENKVFKTSYRELCENPKSILTEFQKFAQQSGYQIELKKIDDIPDEFEYKTLKKDENPDITELKKALQAELKKTTVQKQLEDISNRFVYE